MISMMAPAKIRHLSVSKIEEAMKCPEKLRFRYLEKIPEASVGIMVAGRVVHKVIERALQGVIVGQNLPSAQDMDDWFQSEWEEHIQEEQSKPSFIGWEWNEGDPESKVRAECRDLVPFVRTEMLINMKPKLVEHGIKMQFGSEIGPFLVWGYLDLFEEDGMLSDWKTVLETPSNNQKKVGVQFPGYSWEILRLTQENLTRCRKIFLCRGTKPRIEIVNYLVGPQLRNYFHQVAAQVWMMTQADAYIPNPNGWWCKPGWCSFYGICQGELEQGK